LRDVPRFHSPFLPCPFRHLRGISPLHPHTFAFVRVFFFLLQSAFSHGPQPPHRNLVLLRPTRLISLCLFSLLFLIPIPALLPPLHSRSLFSSSFSLRICGPLSPLVVVCPCAFCNAPPSIIFPTLTLLDLPPFTHCIADIIDPCRLFVVLPFVRLILFPSVFIHVSLSLISFLYERLPPSPKWFCTAF